MSSQKLKETMQSSHKRAFVCFTWVLGKGSPRDMIQILECFLHYFGVRLQRDRESRPCQLCLSIQTRLPLQPEMQSSLEATGKRAIKYSPLETIVGLSAKSAELGWISRPLPYHLCMPIYEHSVISGREYISSAVGKCQPPRLPESTSYTIQWTVEHVVCY